MVIWGTRALDDEPLAPSRIAAVESTSAAQGPMAFVRRSRGSVPTTGRSNIVMRPGQRRAVATVPVDSREDRGLPAHAQKSLSRDSPSDVNAYLSKWRLG